MNIFHYVGLERNITQMSERFFQKVCRDAVRAVVTRILNKCFQQLLLENMGCDREVKMRRNWAIQDYVIQLSEIRMTQYIENVYKAKCKAIQNHQKANYKRDEIVLKKQQEKSEIAKI